MEFVSRILDSSISYTPRGEPRGRSFFGGRVSQDDKIDRLEEVGLLAECSRRQLRAIARISEVIDGAASAIRRVRVGEVVVHLHRQTDHLMPFGLEQIRGRRRVDAAGHGHGDLHGRR